MCSVDERQLLALPARLGGLDIQNPTNVSDHAFEASLSQQARKGPLIQHQGFSLNKGEFRDALSLRYGWFLVGTPTHCNCGRPFTTDHAMICPKGGFLTICHNELRATTMLQSGPGSSHALSVCGLHSPALMPTWVSMREVSGLLLRMGSLM